MTNNKAMALNSAVMFVYLALAGTLLYIGVENNWPKWTIAPYTIYVLFGGGATVFLMEQVNTLRRAQA